MNCTKGDLAIVVKSRTGKAVGKVVTCIRLLMDQEHNASHLGPLWLVDREFMWILASLNEENRPWWPDSWLMPINPLNDESMTTLDVIAIE